MPGPAPKRSSERRRRNAESKVETLKVTVGAVVEIPKPNPQWHPIAKDWYVSLASSGQAQFFEPSDWQYARYVADAMSRNLKSGLKFSAMLFATVSSAMNDLLTTEASRRRVRMEIERGGTEPAQPAGVTAIADYRKSLAGGRAKKP
jgi:nucleoid-associated protein YgaU